MSQGNEKLTLEERAVTAVLAPLFLHIVLLVLACLRPARSHALGMAVLPLMMGSDRPLGAYLFYLWLAPALFGFLLGELSLRACYEQLCYCSEDRKNPLVTLLLWLLLLLMLGGLFGQVTK